MEKLSGPAFVSSLEDSGVRLRVSGRLLIARGATSAQLGELRERWDEIFRLVTTLQRGGSFFVPLRSVDPRQVQAIL